MRWLDSITDSLDMNWSKLREIVKDRGAWRAAVHGVAKGWTWLSDGTTTKHQCESAFNAEDAIQSLGQEDPLEKEMPTHSTMLAWRMSWTGEPGVLQSMESHRVGHDWVTEQQQRQSLAISIVILLGAQRGYVLCSVCTAIKWQMIWTLVMMLSYF